jgi:hypothetical protein
VQRTNAHVSIKATARLSVKTASRHNLATSHLWAASHFASLAEKVELQHQDSRWDEALTPYINEHRAYVIGSVVTASSFIESLINEFFADAHDHADKLYALGNEAITILARMWDIDHFNRASTLEKYKASLKVCGKPGFDREDVCYKNSKLLLELRNTIVHFKPEFGSEELDRVANPATAHQKLGRSLMRKFDPCKLGGIDKRGNAFFPSKCLGAGCARWGVKSSFLFAEAFYEKMGLPAPFSHLKAELGL